MSNLKKISITHENDARMLINAIRSTTYIFLLIILSANKTVLLQSRWYAFSAMLMFTAFSYSNNRDFKGVLYKRDKVSQLPCSTPRF